MQSRSQCTFQSMVSSANRNVGARSLNASVNSPVLCPTIWRFLTGYLSDPKGTVTQLMSYDLDGEPPEGANDPPV